MATQEQVDKLLKLNLQNIVKKLRDGKTLTKREADLLEQEKEKSKEPQFPEFAKNVTELAKILKVPRKTIYEWRVKPNSPGTEKNKIPVREWIEWVSENTRVKSVDGDSLNSLTSEYKQEQIKNLKIKNDQLMGALVNQDLVIECIEGLVYLVRQAVLRSGMSNTSKDLLMEELRNKKDVFFKELIEKNRKSLDDSESD